MFSDHSYSLIDSVPLPNGQTSKETSELDQIVCNFLREQKVPGATLAIAKNGCIVHEQGYGIAGVGRRMTASNKLRIASISKPITAIAILRLCEEGRLSLHDRVFGSKGILKKLTSWRDKRTSLITVRHLLQHSAGWDRDTVGDAVFWRVPPTQGVPVTSPQYNTHLLQYVLRRKLQFTPGTKHAYSNLGYLVLGEVIEAVTGTNYEDYTKGLLAEIGIMGMYVGAEERVHWQSPEVEYFNIKEPTTAASLLPGHENEQVLPQYGSFLMRNTGAYGGWVATVREILQIFCSLDCQNGLQERLLHDAKVKSILKQASISTMLERPKYEPASSQDWYGLGLDVQDGGTTWGHSGAMEGTCGTVQHHTSGLSWAFLLNAWAADMDLDGMIKWALSSVQELSPFPHGLLKQLHWEMGNTVNNACNTRKASSVMTADRMQRVLLAVPEAELEQQVEVHQQESFSLVWVGVSNVAHTYNEDVCFTLIFSKRHSDRLRLQIQTKKSLKSHSDGSWCLGTEINLHKEITVNSHHDLVLDKSVERQRQFRNVSETVKYFPKSTCSNQGGDTEPQRDRNQFEVSHLMVYKDLDDMENVQQSHCDLNSSGPPLHRSEMKEVKNPHGVKVLTCKLSELVSTVRKYADQRYKPKIVTVYGSENMLRTIIVMSPITNQEFPVLYIDIPADIYIKKLAKKKKNGFYVLSQCVYQKNSHLYITALLSQNINLQDTFPETQEANPSFSSRSHRVYSNNPTVNLFSFSDMDVTDKIDHIENAMAPDKTEPSVNIQCAMVPCSAGSVLTPNPTTSTSPSFTSCLTASEVVLATHKTSEEGPGYQNCQDIPYLADPRNASVSVRCTGERDDVKHVPVRSCKRGLKCFCCTSSSVLDECRSGGDDSPVKRSKRKNRPEKRGKKDKKASSRKNLSWVQMTVDSFIAELGRQARNGCGLTDVQFYPAGDQGEWYVSGVWVPQDKSSSNCYHRFSISSHGLLPALAEAAARNIQLRFLCPYVEDGTMYYAAFWDVVNE